MGKVALKMSELPQAWQQALNRVARARSSKIHMPAALLVTLDMIEAGRTNDGRIEFAEYERRFKELMQHVRPSAANTAWAPFYHLSTKSRLWDLYLGEEKADFSEIGGSPKSRSRVVKRADQARFSEELVSGLSDPEAIQVIRAAVYAILQSDGDEDCDKLVLEHSG